MNNPFKEILSDEKLPELIKERVMADIALIKLSIDMADLFVVKYPGVFSDFLKDKETNLSEDSTQDTASDD